MKFAIAIPQFYADGEFDPASFRAYLAKSLSTLDQLSRGRIEVHRHRRGRRVRARLAARRDVS